MTLLSHLDKDLRLQLRDRQSLLIGLLLPAAILVAYAQLDLGTWTRGGRDPDAFILMVSAVLPALLLGSTAILAERRTGTLSRLRRGPASELDVLLSKALTTLLLLAVQVALILLVARFTLGANASQDPPGLALLLMTTGLTAHALGLVLSGISRSDGMALQLSALTFLLMLTLAGFLRPLNDLGLFGDIAGVAPLALGYRGAQLLFQGRATAFEPLALVLSWLVLLGLALLITRLRRAGPA